MDDNNRTTIVVAEYVRDNVDWPAMFNMLAALGSTLNGRKDRFDKAEIIEKGLDVFSDGKLSHIDSIGADHYISELGVRVEVKFVSNNLYTKITNVPKKFSNAKLTNTMGSSDGRSLDKTFDYLLLLETRGAAMISHQDLCEFTTSNGDGLHARIPCEVLTVIQTPDDLKRYSASFISVSCASYKTEKEAAINKFLERFRGR